MQGKTYRTQTLTKILSFILILLFFLFFLPPQNSAEAAVNNGSFESGFSGWAYSVMGSGMYWQTYAGTPDFPGPGTAFYAPSNGTYAAAIYQTTTNGAVTLYQDITLASNSTHSLAIDVAHQNFSTWTGCGGSDIRGSSCQHYQVDIIPPGSNPWSLTSTMQMIYATAPGYPNNRDYTTYTVDLSAYAGQTVRLRAVGRWIYTEMNAGLDNAVLTSTPLNNSLSAGKGCSGSSAVVNITNGDAPFNITTSNSSGGATGVGLGPTYLSGPDYFANITVQEQSGDHESINLGDIYCGSQPVVYLNPSSMNISEGGSSGFSVNISPVLSVSTTVYFSPTDGTATYGQDYIMLSSSPVTIPAHSGGTSIGVGTIGDSIYEGNENFTVALTSASGSYGSAAIGSGPRTVTIIDNEPTPQLYINNLSATEGSGNAFTISINPIVAANTDISFSVTDGSATTPADYSVTSTSPVTIPANGTTAAINFTTVDDALFEGAEDFVVDLTGATNALVTPIMGDSQGTATINDNEPTPNITIDDPVVTEGSGGSFTVSISPAVNAATDVSFTVTDGGATTPADYSVISTSPVTIPAGATSITIDFTTVDDALFEGAEDFVVDLTGATNVLVTPSIGDNQGTATINDNESTPTLSISPATVTHDEGNTGTTAYVFTVTLSGSSASTVTVDYTTNDVSATTADSDYVDNDGILTFNSGDPLTQNITVLVNGDTTPESNEEFTVTLNNSTVASIDGANDTSTGTITNDDFGPDNDLFANATPILLDLGTTPTLEQSALNATVSGTDPSLWCAADYTSSVWFAITPQTEDQRINITTPNSEFDTVAALFIGTEGNLNILACNDDHLGGGVTTSDLSIHALPAQTYYLMVAKKGTTPVQPGADLLRVSIASQTDNNDALVLFDPATSDTALFDQTFGTPLWEIAYTNTPPSSTASEWVMGDWNGDGVRTPGLFDSGVFRYTNDMGPSTNWSSGIWLGNAGGRVAVVAGRYVSGFPNDSGNDCIGWVDSNTSPVTGNLRFSLKYWCDMTASGAVSLSAQWLGSPLGDSAGFAGTHQFVYADWDTDGLDEPAVRRGGRIARSNSAPSEGAATFGSGAQRWDTGDGDGPGAHGLDEGVFVAGDWNGNGQDTWGVVYDDGDFYYRDNISAFNPGPFEFQLQTFTTSVGTPRQVDSHHNGYGGTSVPGPAGATIVRASENTNVIGAGGTLDTSQNVEAELSVSKAGNYQVGEVGLVGDAISWTITVANTGTASANGVQVTDNVPSELRVDDVLSDTGTITVRGQTVIFTAESIGVGETVQFQVVTTILSQPSSGTFANSVNVVLPDGNGNGSDANLVASGTVNSVDGLPATGYAPKFRW